MIRLVLPPRFESPLHMQRSRGRINPAKQNQGERHQEPKGDDSDNEPLNDAQNQRAAATPGASRNGLRQGSCDHNSE
jgi:hypothetical protein